MSEAGVILLLLAAGGCAASPYEKLYEASLQQGEGLRLEAQKPLESVKALSFKTLESLGYHRFLHTDQKHQLFVVVREPANRIVRAVNPDGAAILVKFTVSEKPPFTQIDFLKASHFKPMDAVVEDDLRKAVDGLAAVWNDAGS